MGLDMYAYTTTRQLDADTDFPANDADQQIHYWRKHPNLHGYMERLYRQKGGMRDFNCTTLRLTSADIELLEDAILRGLLPETQGFFFGQSDGSEREDDLTFIAQARAGLAEGLAIYYSSWW